MEDALTLPVSYGGKEYEFPFRILSGGYVQRYAITIDSVEVIYEHDDSGELRAIIHQPESESVRLPGHGLLDAVSSVLQQLIGRP